MKTTLPFPVPPVRQSGVFRARLVNPDGTVADEWPLFNAAVYDGLNHMQDATFKAGAQQPAWYIGLIDNAGYTGISISDTMASHAGWAELTGYSQGTRVAWATAAPALGVLTGSAAAVFTISANATMKGMFLTSGSAKSGTAGKLWATALEASPRSLVNLQSLQVFYSNTLTPVS